MRYFCLTFVSVSVTWHILKCHFMFLVLYKGFVVGDRRDVFKLFGEVLYCWCQFVFVNLLINKLLQTTFFKFSFYKMVNISYFDMYNNIYFDCSFSNNHINQECIVEKSMVIEQSYYACSIIQIVKLKRLIW